MDDNYDSGVFWYDNGKKAIPLIDGNAELPQEVKFEPIQGEQQSIFDPPEQDTDETDLEITWFDDESLEQAEPQEKKYMRRREVPNE